MTQNEKCREIKARTLAEAEFIVKTHATIRETAKISGVSASTVHRDVVSLTRLYIYSRKLYNEVRDVLNENGAEAPMRGGMATQQKYRRLREAE